MSKKLFLEKINSKKEELKTITESALEEVRALTTEEDTKVEDLKNEIRGLEKMVAKIEEEEQELEQEETRAEEVDLIGEAIGNVLKTGAKEIVEFEQVVDEKRAMNTGTNEGKLIPTIINPEPIRVLTHDNELWDLIPKYANVDGKLAFYPEVELQNSGFIPEGNEVTTKDPILGEPVSLGVLRCGTGIEITKQLQVMSPIARVEYLKSVLSRRVSYNLDKAVVSGLVANGEFEGLVNAKAEREVLATEANKVTPQDMLATYEKLHDKLRSGAVWIMNQATYDHICNTFKDGQGNLVMFPNGDPSNGQPKKEYLNCKIILNEEVPSATKMYFVNFGRAYAGIVRNEIEFANIGNDTINRMGAKNTLLMDILADAKIVDHKAISVLKNKA